MAASAPPPAPGAGREKRAGARAVGGRCCVGGGVVAGLGGGRTLTEQFNVQPAFLFCLAQRGLLDNTLVIILSQHGENFGEHGLLVHSGSIHEPLVHIPIIMRYPARIPHGTVVSDFVQQTDIALLLLLLLYYCCCCHSSKNGRRYYV